jgi:hypothetical protein
MPSHFFYDVQRQECYNHDPEYRHDEYKLEPPLLPLVHENLSHSPAVFQHFRGDHFFQDNIADADNKKIIQLASEDDGIRYQINGRNNIAERNQDDNLGIPGDPVVPQGKPEGDELRKDLFDIIFCLFNELLHRPAVTLFGRLSYFTKY